MEIAFRINMVTPDIKIPENMEPIQAVRLYCAKELKMPPEMLKAISLEERDETNRRTD